MRKAQFRLAVVAVGVAALSLVAAGTATAGSSKVTGSNTEFNVYFTPGATPSLNVDVVTVSRNVKPPTGQVLYEVCDKPVSPDRCVGRSNFVYERTAVGEPWHAVDYVN